MSAFGNVFVINQLVPETGGVFAGGDQTIDFDPDGDGDFEQGGTITYEDGTTQAMDIEPDNNVALVTAMVTYADGQQIEYQNLAVHMLDDGNTLVYAFDAGEAGATIPVPLTYTVPVSIEFEPFEYNYDYFQSIDEELVDFGGDEQPPCFASGTLIETLSGPAPVETIKTGTFVKTKDNGLQAVKWVGKTRISRKLLQSRPDLQPIRLKAGALHNSRDLILSPTHRVLLRGWRAEMLFGVSEVLVAARDLVNDSTIVRFLPEEGVNYHHFMLDAHEIVFCEGAQAESLHPNLSALGEKSRREILQLFPELEHQGKTATARKLAASRLVSLLNSSAQNS